MKHLHFVPMSPFLLFFLSTALAQAPEISAVPNQCGQFRVSGTLALIEGVPSLQVHSSTQSETVLILQLNDTPRAREAGLRMPALLAQRVEISGTVTSRIQNQRGQLRLDTLQRANPKNPEGFTMVKAQLCQP